MWYQSEGGEVACFGDALQNRRTSLHKCVVWREERDQVVPDDQLVVGDLKVNKCGDEGSGGTEKCAQGESRSGRQQESG